MERKRFYSGIGFHRSFYTPSNIHFHDNETANYDFKLYHVKAKDDNRLKIGEGMDAPQYTVVVGYYFNTRKELALELSYDHAKYIARPDQVVWMDGQINGASLRKDTTLSRDFITYEHTHGANHFMVNFLRRNSLLQGKNAKCALDYVVKAGAGIAVPHSNTTVLGNNRDDTYHLAGYLLGIENTIQFNFLRNFFLYTSVKTAYVHYGDVLVYGQGRADQHWFSLQAILVMGFQL